MASQEKEAKSMANYTLRLPADLKELAEEEAKAHGRELSEELRLALASYYERPWGLVTNKDLSEKIREHEERFHVKIIGVDGSCESFSARGLSFVSPDSKAPLIMACQAIEPPIKPDPDIIHGASGFDFPRSEALRYLQGLKDMLADNVSPTPTDLETYFGKPSRRIGRILHHFSLQAKNTRVQGVSSRFFLPSMLGDVEKALKKLEEEV